MLVIPRFKDYIDKSLETLIEIRQKVIKEIVEYEDKYILKNIAIYQMILQ